jgi:hypothetical protein
MKYHWREARPFGNELDIYVGSAIQTGNICRVMSIPLLPEEKGLDFEDKNNVQKVIARHLTDTSV